MGQLTNLHFFFIFLVFSLRQCSLHYLIQTKVVVETKGRSKQSLLLK